MRRRFPDVDASHVGWGGFPSTCSARHRFATTLPWIASLELFLDTGVETIASWDQHLIDALLNGLDHDQHERISPADGPTRTTLVVLSRRDGSSEHRHRQLVDAGIDAAYREGNVRLSVHLFNTAAQIDGALDALHA